MQTLLESSNQRISVDLQTNLESFRSDLNMGNFLKQSIVTEEFKLAKELAGSAPTNLKCLQAFCTSFFENFSKNQRFEPIFVIVANVTTKATALKKAFHSEISPGKRSSQIILEFLASPKRNQLKASKTKFFFPT